MATPRLLKTINFHFDTIQRVDALRGKQSYADWFAGDPRLSGYVEPPAVVLQAPQPPPAIVVPAPAVASPPAAAPDWLREIVAPETVQKPASPQYDLLHWGEIEHRHSLTFAEKGELIGRLMGDSGGTTRNVGKDLWIFPGICDNEGDNDPEYILRPVVNP